MKKEIPSSNCDSVQTTLVVNAAISALLNVAILAGVPFLFYFVYHTLRHKRRPGEILQRAGCKLGEGRADGRAVAPCLGAAVVLFGCMGSQRFCSHPASARHQLEPRRRF